MNFYDHCRKHIFRKAQRLKQGNKVEEELDMLIKIMKDLKKKMLQIRKEQGRHKADVWQIIKENNLLRKNKKILKKIQNRLKKINENVIQ